MDGLSMAAVLSECPVVVSDAVALFQSASSSSSSSLLSSSSSSSSMLSSTSVVGAGEDNCGGVGVMGDMVCGTDLMQISNDPSPLHTPTPSSATNTTTGHPPPPSSSSSSSLSTFPPPPPESTTASSMGLGVKTVHTNNGMNLPPSQQQQQNSTAVHTITSQQHPAHQPQQQCSACKKAIRERYLLKALDQLWHEDCLKCSCCDCRLGEVGSTLFAKANLLLCRRDYLRLFGTTGYCAACNKMIPAFEMVMRARGNVYHLECFACQQCNHRFCVGDRFYLCDNKILCEFDYEDRFMFPPHLPPGPAPPTGGLGGGGGGGGGNGLTNGPLPHHHPSPYSPYTPGPGYNALTQMKRQTQSLSDDVSSGYGSPSPSSL